MKKQPNPLLIQTHIFSYFPEKDLWLASLSLHFALIIDLLYFVSLCLVNVTLNIAQSAVGILYPREV